MYKTWRVAKYRTGEKSHGKVLSSFWFGQQSGTCTLPTGPYGPLHHGLWWNLERVIRGWEVKERGLNRPLSSPVVMQAACHYLIELRTIHTVSKCMLGELNFVM